MRHVGRSLALLSLAVVPVHAASIEVRRGGDALTRIEARVEGGALVRIDEQGARAHPSRLLVKFERGRRAFLPGSGAARGFARHPDLFLVDNPRGLSVAAALARYRAQPHVVYAEPDFEVRAIAVPTDPRWGEQWDLTKIDAPAAWATQTDASDTVVAVIDTGIDFTHPDLVANLWTNPDDGVSHGFSCLNGTVAVGGFDDHGHGTHVAGTIGAVANNGIGIAGINWNASIMSLKFLNSGGSGNISDAVNCFGKAAELVANGVNLRVTNNSWGGGGYSQALVDAMLDLEAGGVVNVCAAGNNGSNADVAPMYPGAYENRGIVSVLATDANDVGAGFTNYGLESVDIAAPGVNTLSTVPPGPCSLCDATGYRLLSGTSMASPHVAGVMAALLHLKPSLTAEEARDVLLDPDSYDAMSDPKANWTSTGGRLDFARAIANPLADAPVLNQFPSVIMGPDASVGAGQQVTLTMSASDPDGDALRASWARDLSVGRQWLIGNLLAQGFPNPVGGVASFTAPNLARAATVPYDAAVADYRGGGDHGRAYATVVPGGAPGLPPAGSFDVAPTSAPAGSTVYVTFTPSDPDGGGLAWDLRIGQRGGTSGWCCFGPGTFGVTFPSEGLFRISAHAMDGELDESDTPSAVVRIGAAAGEPPIAAGTLSELSGPVPFTTTWDLSASSDPDGSVTSYCVTCGGTGFGACGPSPVGTCTFDTPGAHWINVLIQDAAGNAGAMSLYAVATPPPGGGDETPPDVALTAPAAGADLAGEVWLAAEASDASGIAAVEFLLDGASSLGTDATAPFGIAWDSGTSAPGTHQLSARATDGAGNVATSAPVAVDVLAPLPPAVSITSPTNGSTVARRRVTTIVAAVTPGSYAVARVDFFVGATLTCSDSSAPYSCDWRVPAKGVKQYLLRARAIDVKGTAVDSSTVTVRPN